MATKSLTVVRPGTYGTRELRAGDVYDASGPDARLYVKLGWMKDIGAQPKAAAAKAPRKRKAKKTA